MQEKNSKKFVINKFEYVTKGASRRGQGTQA